MEPRILTRWLAAEDYVAVIVVEEEQDTDPPIDLDRMRALGLLARASRRRRRTSAAPLQGVLALIRA